MKSHSFFHPQSVLSVYWYQGYTSYLDQCSLYLSTRLKKYSLYAVQRAQCLCFIYYGSFYMPGAECWVMKLTAVLHHLGVLKMLLSLR